MSTDAEMREHFKQLADADVASRGTCGRLSGEPCGPGTFAVESASEPGREWAVDWQNVAVRYCGCPQFARRQTCRHVLAVQIFWREEHEAMLAAHRADPVRMAAVGESLERMKETFS